MKTIFLQSILLISVSLMAGRAAANDAVPSEQPRIFLGIVVDTSATSSKMWDQRIALARQSMNPLLEDDRVAVFLAGPDNTVLMLDNSAMSSGADNTLTSKCLEGIQQSFFLFRADLAKAIELAFDHLQTRGDRYDCCLLVLTDGAFDDAQTRRICRSASAYRMRGWPLLLTVTASANKQLLLAANRGELEVSLIDEFQPAQWLTQVRNQFKNRRIVKVPPPPKQPPPEDKTAVKSENIKPVDVNQPPEHAKAEQPRFLLPVYPWPADTPPYSPVNDIGPVASTRKSPLPPPKPQQPQLKKATLPGHKGVIIAAMATTGSLAALLALFSLITMSSHRQANTSGEENRSHSQDYQLIAVCNGERYDLGDEENINNLVFGAIPGSAIPLAEENLEDEVFSISSTDGKLHIRNLSKRPLSINGAALKKGKKRALFLPTSIDVTENLKIDLFRENKGDAEQESNIEGEIQ